MAWYAMLSLFICGGERKHRRTGWRIYGDVDSSCLESVQMDYDNTDYAGIF